MKKTTSLLKENLEKKGWSAASTDVEALKSHQEYMKFKYEMLCRTFDKINNNL